MSNSDDYKERDMPRLDLYGSNVDLRTVAPLYGVPAEQEPEYLDYDIKVRLLKASHILGCDHMLMSG